jgi:hypothetical protein
MAARCKPISDALEIHYWTGPDPGDPCECGQARRPTAEERAAARRKNFTDWFVRQPGVRRERTRS